MQERIEISNVAAAITSEVEEFWREKQRAMPLAAVGSILNKRCPGWKSAVGNTKLVEFVRQHLANSIEPIQSPHDELTWGLAPKSETGGKTPQDLFPAKELTAKSVESTAKRVIFDKHIWVSFSHPLSEGHFRTVALDPRITYQDSQIEEVTPGRYKVDRDLIVPLGMEIEKRVRDDRIESNIKSWALTNSIDLDRLIAKENTERENSFIPHGSLLTTMLNALTPDEKERTSLPLDVVEKLMLSIARKP